MRKIAGLATTIVLLVSAIWVAPVSAYTGSCGQTIGSGTLYVKLFEGRNYETGSNTAQLCIRASGTGSTNVPDLNNVAYTGSSDHICDGQLIQDYGNWNDCASSIQSQFSDCHHTITVYSGTNYTNGYTANGKGWPSWSSTVNFPDLGDPFFNSSPDPNNSISSLKVTYHSVCQSAPVQ